MEKKNYVFSFLIIICGIACAYYMGMCKVKKYYEKENETSVIINRSELDGLGKIDGTIYVTGHKSPDSDTVCSSIAYANLLNKLGYDAKPVVLGEINKESKYILESAGVEIPELLENAEGKNMVLVDHSEYSQSADGLEKANVISIIDHHSDGSVTTSNQLIYDSRPLGSTGTIIWIRYKNYGIEIDSQTAKVLVGAILSDTKNLQSGNTTKADKIVLADLCQKAKIKNVDEFYNEMYKASISYDGMTDEEIFKYDYKEYEVGDAKYCVGCMNVYDEESAKDMASRMKAVMSSYATSSGMDMAFALITGVHDDINFSYLVPSDEKAEEILKEAFGDVAEYDGTSYVVKPSFSRKKDFVPKVSDLLEQK